MKSIARNPGVLLLVGSFAWAVIAACSSDGGSSTFVPGADAGDDTGSVPTFGGQDGGATSFADFGAGAIIDTGDGGAGSATTPANAADLFTAATTAGGDAGDGSSPCLSEPEVDSLVPKNWLRPRFSWAGSGGANLFEIRVHASNQTNDLVVYTNATQWIMPAATWNTFASHSAGADITISIRGGTLANGVLTNVTQGSHGAWSIAPVDAPGSIVYWYITNGVGALKGFSVGDEDTREVLLPGQAQEKPSCIGCHTSTPDGNFAVFSTSDNNWGTGVGSVKAADVGTPPSFVTPAARNVMKSTMKGQTSTSAAWWMTGKHYIASVREDQNALAFVNLDETDASKVLTTLATTGMPAGSKPSAPAWSRDGTKIAFTAGGETTGRTDGANNDVYVVPFNETGASVAAAPLAGAATDANEYYPAYSPGDKLVAFTSTTKGENSYAAEHAEIMVVSAAGGTAQRLAANDPPTCSGKKSPGVENSWPKWAPAGTSQTIGDKTYYWLVFSSTRNAADRGSAKRQLFMAPVVVDAAGNISQYKAVYLWNQPTTESNHTPAWDVFAIPPSTGGGIK